MSLKTKPSRVSGKNPAYMKGDYAEVRQTQTQQDLINEGKKFKHSVLKKPYVNNLSYQEMEYEATPLGRGADMTPLAMFPRIKGFDTTPIIDIPEIGKYPCECLPCRAGGLIGKDPVVFVKDAKGKTRTLLVKKGAGIAGVPSTHQCVGTGIETLYIFICGRQDELIHLESAHDSMYLVNSMTIPFSDESKCTKIDRCACHTIGININCGKGFTDCTNGRNIRVLACSGEAPIKILPSSSACSALTIVDEDGSDATDTILRNGSNDYKTTGDCCENIVWSVGAGTGQLGGSTITQTGVLTAGGTACGSLLVTATCSACGTSDNQYVRVTDAGQWVFPYPWYDCAESPEYPYCCRMVLQDVESIKGKDKEVTDWWFLWDDGVGTTCYLIGDDCNSWVQFTPTPSATPCSLPEYTTLIASICVYHGIGEWKC